MAEIKKLIEGNQQFRKRFFNEESTLYKELVEHGQKPKTMLIACSDSRVDPAMVFNCLPGELFVIRNVANLVPPCEKNDTYHGVSASLEFGTCFLEVENIIVFGHTQCGGIKALLENSNKVVEKKQYSFISKWMELARPAYDTVVAKYGKLPLNEKVILCEQYTLTNSLNNLLTFPWIKERVDNGNLSLHAWYFDLETGEIHIFDQEKKNWSVL